jgi:hypothetical protein
MLYSLELDKADVKSIPNATASNDTISNDRDLMTLAALLYGDDEKAAELAASFLDINRDDLDLDALRESVDEAVTTLYDRYGYNHS